MKCNCNCHCNPFPIIYKGRTVEINLRVYRTHERVSEDFFNCTAVKLFLVIGGVKQYTESTIDTDASGLKYIHAELDTTNMTAGAYDLKVVWIRPRPMQGDYVLSENQINTSHLGSVFGLTNVESEDNTDHAVSTNEILNVETFAQVPVSDGLSAYELAVLHGYTGTEEEWIEEYEGAEERVTELEAAIEAAEELRSASESDRVLAEIEREASESSRESAESIRIISEGERSTSEEIRASAEIARIASEAERVQAETERESQSASDHATAVEDSVRAGTDHTQAASDHTTAASDHSTASADHTQAESDHTTASADHTTATSDHTTAAADHTQAESDHTTASADHTNALEDRDNAITSTEVHYAEGTSATDAPTTGWQSDLPTVAAGNYLWSRITITFGDESTKVLYNRSVVPTVTLTEDQVTHLVTLAVGGSAFTPKLVSETKLTDLGTVIVAESQTLTDSQKEQARENIGAASEEEIIETLRTSRNCCDKNATDVAVGKYIYDDGTLKSNSAYNTTGYIDVTQGTTYYLIANDKAGTARNIMFYDSQKNPTGTRQSTLSYVTAPENAKYIRATYKVEQWNDVYISDIYGAYDEFNTSDFIRNSMLNQIEGDKIKNQSIELQKLGSTIIETKNSVNLFNLGACTAGKSFSNILRDSDSYFLSEAIPVESGELYTFTCPTSARFIAFLNNASDTSSISYVQYANAVTVPEGARYVRITVSNNHLESELSFVKGDYTHYEPYHATRNCVKLADENVDASNLAKNVNTLRPYQRLSKSVSSLASGEKIDINNINVSKGIFICAHIEGPVEDVLVGISKNGTYGGWIEVTDTNVILHKGEDGTVVSTQSHNLSLSDSTLITINRDLGDATVTLFNCETGEKWQGIFAWGVYSGNIFVYNGNSNDTIDVELSFVPKDINERLWMFGDSYMSYSSDSRWMYHALTNGYTHFLLNAKGGEKSDQALLDFKHLLSIGPRPTMAVWTLGGNDPEDGEMNNNWLVNIREFIWLCEYNGITPILYTVPTTADRDHSRKCAWVRNSGYRYIEAALAVEGDEQYTWKGNGTDKDMLGPDRLHPSVYGAVALYAAVLRDLPEISVL